MLLRGRSDGVENGGMVVESKEDGWIWRRENVWRQGEGGGGKGEGGEGGECPWLSLLLPKEKELGKLAT